jgi:CubicO group peptidase (beta-lactamase class C family)
MRNPPLVKLLFSLVCITSCASTLPAPRQASDKEKEEPPAREMAKEPLSKQQLEKLRSIIAIFTKPPMGTGAVLSLSYKEKQYSIAVGEQWEKGPAVTSKTRFNMASVSKLLTAAKIVSLAKEQRIHLSDDVHTLFPGVVLIDKQGRDRSTEVTFRHLLNHRSGLPHQPNVLNSIFKEYKNEDWRNPNLLTKVTGSLKIELTHELGTYSYSNFGYALLGALIEKLESKPLAEIMNDFLSHHAMVQATFSPENLQAEAAHGRIEHNGKVTFNRPGWYASRYALPYSGLWASMPDMIAFGKELISARFHDQESFHEMTVLDTPKGHGLGPIHRQRLGFQSLEHDGGSPGFMSLFLAIPEQKFVLAMASNTNGEDKNNAQRQSVVVKEILRIVFKQ